MAEFDEDSSTLVAESRNSPMNSSVERIWLSCEEAENWLKSTAK
jgi:hypothetical protein